MSISEHFRYRIDVFQSDIFVSDIGITDVDVGCRMSDIADIEIDVDAHLCILYICTSFHPLLGFPMCTVVFHPE
jgi:hypothetical protein